MTDYPNYCHHCAAYYQRKARDALMAETHRDWHGYISFVEPVKVILDRHDKFWAQAKVYSTASIDTQSYYYLEHLSGVR